MKLTDCFFSSWKGVKFCLLAFSSLLRSHWNFFLIGHESFSLKFLFHWSRIGSNLHLMSIVLNSLHSQTVLGSCSSRVHRISLSVCMKINKELLSQHSLLSDNSWKNISFPSYSCSSNFLKSIRQCHIQGCREGRARGKLLQGPEVKRAPKQ